MIRRIEGRWLSLAKSYFPSGQSLPPRGLCDNKAMMIVENENKKMKGAESRGGDSARRESVFAPNSGNKENKFTGSLKSRSSFSQYKSD